ncbi:DUF2975 domain-containing protein [Candidatus Neomarinimicrobiota bacterium]
MKGEPMAKTEVNRTIVGVAGVLLAFIWYAGIAAAVALTVYELAINSEGPEVGYPVRFKIEEQGVLPFNDELVFEVEINRAEGELRIKDALPWGLKLYSQAVVLLGMAISLGIVFCLRRIVGTLKTGSPFIVENARRLRWIAVLIIGLGVSERFFTWTYYRLFTSKIELAGIDPHMLKLNDLTFGMPWDFLTAGILVLLLAEVFRMGVELQDEQRLTV